MKIILLEVLSFRGLNRYLYYLVAVHKINFANAKILQIWPHFHDIEIILGVCSLSELK